MAMHHIALCTLMHCTLYLVSHICTFALDPAEPELEEPLDPSPTGETNPE
jgi:hypothetical protein